MVCTYRVTLISKILKFQKAGSTTSRYMDHKTGSKKNASSQRKQAARSYNCIIFFCNMDGFFRILEKRLSQLIMHTTVVLAATICAFLEICNRKVRLGHDLKCLKLQLTKQAFCSVNHLSNLQKVRFEFLILCTPSAVTKKMSQSLSVKKRQ